MDKITLERLAPKGCKLTFSCEHKPEVLQIFCAQILHQNLQITLTEARVTYFTSLHKKKTYKLFSIVRHLCFRLYSAWVVFSPPVWVPIMQLEPLVHSLSVASFALLVEEKTNDEGKINNIGHIIIEKCLHKWKQWLSVSLFMSYLRRDGVFWL